MKASTLIVCASFMLSAGALAQEPTRVQAGAANQSSTSVTADKSGASATHSGDTAAAATTDHASANIAQGTELNATLTKPVDAGKAKPGDQVTATLAQDLKSDGRVIAKKGSKLIGHVTAAKPHGKASGAADGNAASQLGIVFDKAVLKDGREVPINATIQALAAAQSGAAAGIGAADAGMAGAGSTAGSARATGGGIVGGVASGAGGAVGGVTGTAGGVVHSGAHAATGVVGKSTGAIGGVNAAGQLSSGSKGVFGMKGVDLASTTEGSASGAVITSVSRNVRLDSGTRMLLVAGASASNSADATDSGSTTTREPVDHR